MLWHHNARVNSHHRWKQTRNRACFHLWCELTNTMNVTEWQVSWNSWFGFSSHIHHTCRVPVIEPLIRMVGIPSTAWPPFPLNMIRRQTLLPNLLLTPFRFLLGSLALHSSLVFSFYLAVFLRYYSFNIFPFCISKRLSFIRFDSCQATLKSSLLSKNFACSQNMSSGMSRIAWLWSISLCTIL